jgi:hypothetical protein
MAPANLFSARRAQPDRDGLSSGGQTRRTNASRRLPTADGGDLETDGKLYRGTGTHRASRWCRTALHLHTVESARDRYNTWAASEWAHAGPAASWLDEHGRIHGMPKPENPYKARTSVT